MMTNEQWSAVASVVALLMAVGATIGAVLFALDGETAKLALCIFSTGVCGWAVVTRPWDPKR